MSTEEVNEEKETIISEKKEESLPENALENPPKKESDEMKAKTLLKGMLAIPKISSTELIRKVLTREPLFKNVYQSDSFTDLLPDEAAEKTASILITGFGLKSLQQLQEALKAEETIKSKKTEAEMFPCICSDESSERSETLPPPLPHKYSIEERVKYLLHLEKYIEIEGEMGSIPPPIIEAEEGGISETKEETITVPAMEKAKNYLKDHKIFQFFQYIMSHLLSACPEDPIDYILALLDRVLLYRTGLISPPLLYEKKHIEQLFNLMDRFGQGHVDMDQYKTAMETFGLCSFNETPPLNQLNMVSRDVFVKEIFSSELAMFDDLIRNRVTCICDLTAPPPTIVDMDLKAQSTTSGENSVSSVEFPPVVSVSKFWEKHGTKQPKVYKGKFWQEFTREIQRRDSDRRDSERRDSERRDSERRDSERRYSGGRDSERRGSERRDSERRGSERRDSERRDSERRNSERRDSERRDSEKRDSERRDIERRDSERRDSERRDNRRRDSDRTNGERKDSGKSNGKRSSEKNDTNRRESGDYEQGKKASVNENNGRRDSVRKVSLQDEDITHTDNERKDSKKRDSGGRMESDKKKSEIRNIEESESYRRKSRESGSIRKGSNGMKHEGMEGEGVIGGKRSSENNDPKKRDIREEQQGKKASVNRNNGGRDSVRKESL